ncbi:MAE_28990/MAE_18760 family HEPN-like nuclease [Streptomyces sp. NPDC002962]|uniref:MAE_28990/MAE_18760 family HEPN-like nuclease n=1 Tax=Streptomyces sp. NPDC002962 TaxID=3364674 RepID=UPI00368238C9
MDLETFSDKIQRDLSLRKLEMSRFSILFQEGRDKPQLELLCRAAAVLSYAHWEGFVKASSAFYIKHINNQRVPVADLKYPLQAAYISSHFRRASESSKTVFLGDVLNQIDKDRKATFTVRPDKCIDTESNLSSKAFKSLVLGLGLPYPTDYETRHAFIDGQLLLGRNQVAHGELASFTREEAEERLVAVRGLLDAYSDQLMDAARDKGYMTTP